MDSYAAAGTLCSSQSDAGPPTQMNPSATPNSTTHIDTTFDLPGPHIGHIMTNQQHISSTNSTGPTGMQPSWAVPPTFWHGYGNLAMPFGDMTIESQDVDMNSLELDMMPWFDSYPTHDMGGLFQPGLGHHPRGSEGGG
jgi:hypothetical protein